jgi:hypothetical protein
MDVHACRTLLAELTTATGGGMAVVLTTHSLLEAEALCTRVGVLVDGTLAALGTPDELKARYGSGPVLHVTPEAGCDGAALAAHLRDCLPGGTVEFAGRAGALRCSLPRAQPRPLAMLTAALAGAPDVSSWALASCTLESVVEDVTARAAAAAPDGCTVSLAPADDKGPFTSPI